MRPPKWYTVYDAKTDNVVVFGFASECYESMGLSSISSFYSTVHDVQVGKNKKWKVLIENHDSWSEDVV